ncbi:ABC transporter ATP-binding protein [Endozoicomonas sp. G2_1]|uniref:ABC transporter ATP-binding protein n=1 Tax=Endozoicomonas sp. G2_1 TaxID=2821091 RepID=UPI001ADBDDF8|nr:ABC transporter ATP-binding protein [Endozoicomonas sp. G2_1]MBO9489845.1 ABC transporter ATP-binding protein [Endozoicomonas sp. G2_1]
MLIKLEGLSKFYRTETIETAALNEINLQINEGDFTSIMGPSGCGKSTLLNILGLISKPDAGDYWFMGTNVSKCNESSLAQIRKENIGFVFQDFNLIHELSVFENIELPLVYKKTAYKRRQNIVKNVIEKLDLSHRSDHLPHQLSGGQQQRVAIARALVNNPKIIFADEPTGNLDSKHRLEVMDILRDINQEGTTIVMVTHSQEDAAMGKNIVRMADGHVLT